jgi:hypothetical protein
VKVFGRRIAGSGFTKFEADAKNSSENATIFPPRAEETKSLGGKPLVRRDNQVREIYLYMRK